MRFVDAALPIGFELLAKTGKDPSDVVLVLVNPRETAGQQIIENHSKLCGVANDARKHLDEDKAIYVAVMGRGEAERVFAKQAPVLPKLALPATPGTVRTVVVAGKTIGTFHMRIPAPNAEADA